MRVPKGRIFPPFFEAQVLHVHFTDDQSFPLLTPSAPQLAEKGAYSRPNGTRYVYSPEELGALQRYAQRRGVLVLPEVDVPG